MQGAKPTKAELADWIGAWIARELKLERGQIDADKTFVRYGMDSVHAMMLVGDLEEHLGRRLPPTLAWDHPTLEALAAHLAQSPEPIGRLMDSRDKDEILARVDELSEEEIDILLKERVRDVEDL